ncbi:hypothetical protein PV517_32450 [Streptomyces griseiscabiei]|uniref:Uncharacterized protein n=1 Tax=Streptomyces griseiscabiei TaxID=2993540 RepID=A0ABU4LD49_9ACTN|nr:hypothetical protein [Streptomyces griseiscabiei]MDX2913366.1 hypothetical protein [Streptomyces griseiscabiei]
MGVDLEGVGEREVVVGQQADRGLAVGEVPAAEVVRVQPAQVVEGDLGCAQSGEPVAQQVVAATAVRDGAQFLLGALDEAGAGLGAGAQAHGVDSGEPADGGGQVRPRREVVAAVALQVDQDRPLAPPTLHGGRERGEQDVVRAGPVGGGQGGQQGPGEVGRDGDGDRAGGAVDVPGGVQRAGPEHRFRGGQQVRPEREFVERGLEESRPAAQRGSGRGEFAALERLGEVGQQDAPGHAVDDQVVQDEEQPAGVRGPVVEPHRPDHHAVVG